MARGCHSDGPNSNPNPNTIPNPNLNPMVASHCGRPLPWWTGTD